MKEAVKIWKILELLKVTEEHFSKNNIESPRLNAELLLSAVLNTKRFNLYMDFDKPLTESELAEFRAMVKRRLTGEPLQYITGETEFYGLKFFVNPSVLIPRPETELLVDKTLEIIHTHKLENPKILEIGTGSGCIPIAMASKMLCSITAIDVSKQAIETAEINSRSNNTAEKIRFENKDVLNDEVNFGEYDIIVSNPPYIAAGEMTTLQREVKDFEPHTALTDNNDGLTFYKRIFELALNAKKDSAQGKEIFILLEIGDGKKESVEQLLKEYSITNYEFFKDLLNIYRVLYIKL